MLVGDLLDAARGHLVIICHDAKLIDAARLLNSGSALLVATNEDGQLRGVVTKTDIVRQMSVCDGAMCMQSAAIAMTRDVMLCGVEDSLADVAQRMKARRLNNIPVVDPARCPIGVLPASAILGALLGEVKYEEAQLIDYVKGIGYR